MKLIVIVIALLMLSACNMKRRCLELFPPVIEENSKRVIEKKDTILPEVIISYAIPDAPISGEPKFIFINDTTGVAELRLKYDIELKKWIAECEAKERKISWEQITDYVSRLERRTDIKEIIPIWIRVLLLLAFIPTVYMVISLLMKYRRIRVL